MSAFRRQFNIRVPTDLEEEANDEHLQASHSNHHQALNNAEVKDSLLGAPDSAEVTVFSGTEVLLVSRNS